MAIQEEQIATTEKFQDVDRNITHNTLSEQQTLADSRPRLPPLPPFVKSANLRKPRMARGGFSAEKKDPTVPSIARTACLCSPTTHAGSFRCRLHRGTKQQIFCKGTPFPGASTEELPLFRSPLSPCSENVTPRNASSLSCDKKNLIARRLLRPNHTAVKPRVPNMPSRFSMMVSAVPADAPSTDACKDYAYKESTDVQAMQLCHL